ncbi:SLC13 family permease [Fundidesulfovibrio agrisoli]|uniref:SLC13 family permease n=1 Tax=Fundidesulfovibrio agrisoli TaxID=2922717 RepID=UPI001FAD03CB
MTAKKWIGLALAFASLSGIIWLLPPIDGLTPAGKASLAVAVFAIVVWVTQAVDDATSGFMIVFLLAALNATTVANAFSGYSNTALWLIVIGFVMAAGMEKSCLSKRIALFLVNLAGGSPIRIYWAVATVMLVLTFLVPSITARTLLMLPIVMGIGMAFNAKEGQSNIVKALIFIVAMSGTIMSIGVLTAHVGNPVTVGLIESATKKAISWSDWFKAAAPPAFSLAFLSVFVIAAMWKPEVKSLGEGHSYIRRELEALGRIKGKEIYTLVVFCFILLLWATDSIHKINVVIVGMVAVILVLWPRFGVMTWQEAQKRVPWNVFIVYGAGLSLGAALVSSGAAKWLAGVMFSPIAPMPQAAQLIILLWVITGLQVFFTGGGPKTTALTPIIIAHATAIGADPMTFALILGLNMPHQYILPVSNMPNAVAMGTGHITAGELQKTGVVISLLAVVFMSLMVLTYWKWIGMVSAG